MNIRIHRLSEAIGNEISQILRTDFQEEAANITVVGALIAPDLSFAEVKFSVLGDKKVIHVAEKFLQGKRTLIKGKLGKKLALRNTPDLKFSITDAIERGNHLIAILEGLEKVGTEEAKSEVGI